MTEPRIAQDRALAESKSRTATFHHVGYVVKSIAEVGEEFARSLGAEWGGEIIHDPLQEAKVTFMFWGSRQGPALELVEPAGDNSPLYRFLAKGGGLHHVCYEVGSRGATGTEPKRWMSGRQAAPAGGGFRRPEDCLGLHAAEAFSGIFGALTLQPFLHP